MEEEFKLEGTKICNNKPTAKIAHITDNIYCANPIAGGKRRKSKRRKRNKRKTTLKQYFKKLMNNFF